MKRVVYVDFAELSKKNKRFSDVKWKLKRGIGTIGDWINRNKELVVVFGPACIGIAATGVKTLSRSIRLRKEAQLREAYCYDRSLGHYWALKRKLTNKEWIDIDKRKKNGERLSDILSELKLLK